jgi:hypothetical protein
MSEKFDIPFKSSFVPTVMKPGTKLKFNCYKGISCFNACCRHADVQLTPYDILRLKENLGVSASEFLKSHTVLSKWTRTASPASSCAPTMRALAVS